MFEASEILFIATGFIAATISTCVGFGSSLILLPLAALLIPTKKAIAVVVIFFLANNLTKIGVFFKNIDWKIAFLQWILGLPLVIAGALLMVYAPSEIIQRTLGLLTIVFVVNHYFKIGGNYKLSNRQIAYFGGINGFIGGLVGAASVIRASVFTHIGLSKESFVGTLAISGFVIDLVKMSIYSKFRLISEGDVPLIIGLVIAAFLGTHLGKIILNKLHPVMFKKAVLILLTIIGTKLLLF